LVKGGRIDISVSEMDKSLVVEITDNGVGRIRSKQSGLDSTGKGQKITQQFLEMYTKLTGKKASMEFIDLFAEDDSPSGSRVIFTFQINRT